MEATTKYDLSVLRSPDSTDTPDQWAAVELGEFGLITSWKDVLRILEIPIIETQSGIITLQRAIRRAKDGNAEQTPTPAISFEPKTPAPAANPDPLLSVILTAIQPYLNAQVSEEQVRKIVQECGIDSAKIIQLVNEYLSTMDLYKGHRIEGVTPEPIQIEGAMHSITPKVLAIGSAKKPVYLYGPAGTGKSMIAKVVSESLGLAFYPMSVCGQSTKSDLAGYMDATGNYVTTIFRAAYEHGGLFLLDEVDNGNPNVLNVLNNALANSCMAFPDGMVQRHPDFRCIAAANTFGTGGTEQYIGRNALDAAFKDRFVSLFVGYDNDLEKALYGEQFCTPIWKARKALEGRTGWVLSMRSIDAYRSLFGVMDEKEALELAFSNLSEDHKKVVFASL
jgi:hypothetical protein